jgi:DNA-binding transcriptional LysR family regulator
VNLQFLKTFLAVRKHLNYTRAAEEVYLSQPAVSRQIKQLESEFGTQLVEQLGKSLHLTKAGQTLAKEAEMLLGALERTREAVQAHSSLEHGALRIGTSTTPGSYLLPKVLGRFHERFPDIDLHYVADNSQKVEQMIIDNSLDFGFVGAYLNNEDLVLKSLLQDEVVCFANPTHPMAQMDHIAPQLLGEELCVMRERGSATRRLFENWLTSHHVKFGRTIQVKSVEAIKNLVAARFGFGFMSIHGLKAEIRANQLRVINVDGMPLSRKIYLVHHAKKHFSPIMEAFMAILSHALRENDFEELTPSL